MQDTKKGMSFWDHISELRSRMKVVLMALLASTIFFLVFPANPAEFLDPQSLFTGMYRPIVTQILAWIRDYVAPKGLTIISLNIGAPLEVYFIAGLVFAVLVSSPVIAYEFYKFVDPALRPEERKSIYPFVTGFTALFVAGAMFGLLVLSPFITYTLIVFSRFVGSEPVISVLDFYSMTLTTVAFTGFGFTIPVIFILLVKFGIVKTSLFTRNRKYIYAGLFVATAIITPDGGPLADVALFLPMLVLMEAAFQISKRYEKPLEGSAEKELRCKFCGHKLKKTSTFCPKCHKSQT